MFVDIQSFFLYTGTHSQSMEFPDAIEEDETTGGSPQVDHQNAEALSSEKSPSVAVEGTVGNGKQPRHQRTEDSANAMHRRRTHRVVDMQAMVDELNRKDQYDSTNKTDDDRAYW